MGDKIIIESIEVIQDGLFQIDLKNETTGKYDRCFVEPEDLFGMIGKAIQKNHDKYIGNIWAEIDKAIGGKEDA